MEFKLATQLNERDGAARGRLSFEGDVERVLMILYIELRIDHVVPEHPPLLHCPPVPLCFVCT